MFDGQIYSSRKCPEHAHLERHIPVAAVKKKLVNDYPWWKVRIWYGMTAGAWFRLLHAYGFKCSASRFHRLLLVSLVTPTNSVLAMIQQMFYGARIESQERPPCVFIIGHWRTGTTFLHELLANDPRLVTPNSLQCYCPSHFLVSRLALVVYQIVVTDKAADGWHRDSVRQSARR